MWESNLNIFLKEYESLDLSDKEDKGDGQKQNLDKVEKKVLAKISILKGLI